MDRSSFRKKVILDLIASPWTLLPAAGGMSLMIASWAMGRGADLPAFLGVAGVLAGVGALCTRWIFRSDQIARNVFDTEQAEERQRQERELDDLDQRLRQDDDPRPEECLEELRAMYAAFQTNSETAGKIGHDSTLEIAHQLDKLFKSCLVSLERSHELWKTAQQMKSRQVSDSLRSERERIVEEIQASTRQMVRVVDELRALAVQQDGGKQLAQIRHELDESLEVARRVEQRMQSFEEELEGRRAHTERE